MPVPNLDRELVISYAISGATSTEPAGKRDEGETVRRRAWCRVRADCQMIVAAQPISDTIWDRASCRDRCAADPYGSSRPRRINLSAPYREKRTANTSTWNQCCQVVRSSDASD
jgi:hypothetical protein